jgi:hypothetical protein
MDEEFIKELHDLEASLSGAIVSKPLPPQEPEPIKIILTEEDLNSPETLDLLARLKEEVRKENEKPN